MANNRCYTFHGVFTRKSAGCVRTFWDLFLKTGFGVLLLIKRYALTSAGLASEPSLARRPRLGRSLALPGASPYPELRTVFAYDVGEPSRFALVCK
jgi:hypothetical protein